jgi:hypothetical protein
MPAAFKPEDPQANKLAEELADWTAQMNEARGVEIETWRKKVAQKQAQLDDAMMLEEGAKYKGLVDLHSPEALGYQDMTVGGAGREYRRPSTEELIRWRLWKRTGGGLMVELGSHQLDAASIFLAASNRRAAALRGEDPNALPDGGKVHPLRVHVSANRNLFGLDREVQDHITTLVEFPAPNYDPNTLAGRKRTITVQYSTINGNGFGGYGETVFGTKGTLQIDLEKEALLYRTSAINDKTRVAGSKGNLDVVISEEGDKLSSAIGYQGVYATDVSRGYCEEIEHWAYCIRKNPEAQDIVDEEIMPLLCATYGADAFGEEVGAKPSLLTRCRGEVAIWDAIIALVTNISADLNTTVEFKPSWFEFDSDETPEFDYAEALVKNAADAGVSEDEIAKRVEAAKANAVPNVNRPEYV